jgi:hypothetical protein
MAGEKQERAALKVSAKLNEEIKIESAKTRMPMYQIVERAWELYKSRGALPAALPAPAATELFAAIPPEHIAWLAKLEYILGSGVEIAIDAVTKNIDAFELLARLERSEVRESEDSRRIEDTLKEIVARTRAEAGRREESGGLRKGARKRAG